MTENRYPEWPWKPEVAPLPASEPISSREDLIDVLITARVNQKISQAELARRVNTRNSSISRFESGVHSVTFDFLLKITNALGVKIELRRDPSFKHNP